MDDKKLTKLSIIVSILGLILVYYASIKIEIKSYDISQIDKSMLDKDVKITGKITNIVKTKTVLILNVKDESASITAVSFDPGDINLKEGQEIEVTGKVALYKNKLEIISDSIKGIND
ncbi:exodeoxyribonuclease VII large subunit [Candidatus Woesearchaeota archaeon]|nr:exodeoxyribonuclease VII large subunit [Candidatus Woesearchaeota archaeon]